MRVSSDMQLLGVCADVPAEMLYLLSPVSSLYPCLTVAEVERLKDIAAAELKELGGALLLVGVVMQQPAATSQTMVRAPQHASIFCQQQRVQQWPTIQQQNHPHAASAPVPIAGLSFSSPPSVHQQVPGPFPSAGPAMAPYGLSPPPLFPQPWRSAHLAPAPAGFMAGAGTPTGTHQAAAWLPAAAAAAAAAPHAACGVVAPPATVQAALPGLGNVLLAHQQQLALALGASGGSSTATACITGSDVRNAAAPSPGGCATGCKVLDAGATRALGGLHDGWLSALGRTLGMLDGPRPVGERNRVALDTARRRMEETRCRQTDSQRADEREAARRRMEETRCRQTDSQRADEREAARRRMEETRCRQTDSQRADEREAAQRRMEDTRRRQTDLQRADEREAARRRMDEIRRQQTDTQRAEEREAARRRVEETSRWQTDSQRAEEREAARRRMEDTRRRQTDAQRAEEREAARRHMEDTRCQQTDAQRAEAREAARRHMEDTRCQQTDAQRSEEREAARRRMEDTRCQQTDAQRAGEREAARRRMEDTRRRQTDAQRSEEREAARRHMEDTRCQQTDAQRAEERDAARQRMEEQRRRLAEAKLVEGQGRPVDPLRLSVLEAVQQRLGVPYDNVANIMLSEAGGLAREVAFARELDRCIRREMPMWLCAICSCIHGRGEVQWVSWDDIPNVQLLRTDIQSTPAVPRDAKVVYRRPLQPDMVAAPPPPPAAVYGARSTGARPAVDDTAADLLSRVRDSRQAPLCGAYGDTCATCAGPAASGAHEPSVSGVPAPASGGPTPAGSDSAGYITYCMRLVMEVPGVSETLQVDCTCRIRNGTDEVRICRVCLQALRAGKVPPWSLARVDMGDVPERNRFGRTLPPLELTETLLLAVAIATLKIVVVRLRDGGLRGPPGIQPRVLAGHIVARPNPSRAQLVAALPRRVEELTNYIQVVMMDAGVSRERMQELLRTATFLTVRGPVVMAWAEHLAEEWQRSISMPLQLDPLAMQELQTLNNVPEALVLRAYIPQTEQAANRLREIWLEDRDGNARVQQEMEEREARGAAQAPSAGTLAERCDGAAASRPAGEGTAQPDGGAAGRRGSVVEDQPTGEARMADAPPPAAATFGKTAAVEGSVLDDFLLQTPSDLAPSYDSLEAVRTTQDPAGRAEAMVRVLVNCAGGPGVALLSNYNSFFLNVTSPQCFPFVLVGQRPDGMSETEYGKLFCRRMHYRGAPPAPGEPRHLLAQNGEALAILFDTKLLHDASRQAAVVVKNSPHHLNAVAGLDRQQVKDAAVVLGGDRRSAARREALQQIPAGVAAFAAALQAVGSKVEGTNAMYRSARGRAAALDCAVGPITVAFNLNPNDVGNRIVAVSAGQSAPCASDGRPLFSEDMHRRLRRVAAYPTLCAAYLQVVADAVLWILFGFRPGDKTQREPHCYMGTVQYVSYKVEESGRRALHLHGTAVVPAFRVATVKAAFSVGGRGGQTAGGLADQLDGLRRRMADIMEAVACQFLPEGYDCPPAVFAYHGQHQRRTDTVGSGNSGTAGASHPPPIMHVPFPDREDYPDQMEFRRFCRHALRTTRPTAAPPPASTSLGGGAPTIDRDSSGVGGVSTASSRGAAHAIGTSAGGLSDDDRRRSSSSGTETDWSELDCEREGSTGTPIVPVLNSQALHLFAMHLCRLALKRQYHTHTTTCFKYDESCRMEYPRVLQMLFRWLADVDAVVLPRCGENLVGYTPTLLLALGCNNNTTLTCDLVREASEYDEWQRQPAAERGPCPVVAGEDRARQQSEYQTKYALKSQNTVNVDTFLRAVARLTAFDMTTGVSNAAAPGAPDPTTAQLTTEASDMAAADAPGPAARRAAPPPGGAAAPRPAAAADMPVRERAALLANLRSAIHTTTGQTTYGMALMAHIRSGGTTVWQSFDTAPLAAAAFVELVNTGTHRTTECVHQVVLEQRTGAVRYATAVRDYLLRCRELHGPTCSPYMLHMAYRKERQDATYHRQLVQPASRRRGRPKRRAGAAALVQENWSSEADDEKNDTSSEDDGSCWENADGRGTASAGPTVAPEPISAAPAGWIDPEYQASASASDGFSDTTTENEADRRRRYPPGSHIQHRAQRMASLQPSTRRSTAVEPARVGFRAVHPQEETHMLKRQKHLRLVQLLGGAPRRAGRDAAAARDEWASWVFAVFASYTDIDVPALAAMRPWDRLVLWMRTLRTSPEGDEYYVYVVRRVLHHLEARADSLQCIRNEAHVRRATLRQLRAEQATAGDGAGSDDGGCGGDSLDSDDQDDPVAGLAGALADTGHVSDEEVLDAMAQPMLLDGTAADVVAEGLERLAQGGCNEAMFSSTAADLLPQPPSVAAPAGAGRNHRDFGTILTPGKQLNSRTLATWVRTADAWRADDDGGAGALAAANTVEELELVRDVEGRAVGARALAFTLLAQAFEADQQGTPRRSLHLLLAGDPGTGKSQAVKAIEWQVFQHGQPTWLTACAFTWRAARGISTPVQLARSTCNTFFLKGIGDNVDEMDMTTAKERVRETIPGRMVCMDEVSFVSQDHLGNCNEVAQRVLPEVPGRPPEDLLVLNGRDLGAVGDPLQHSTTGGLPLHAQAYLRRFLPTRYATPKVPSAPVDRAAQRGRDVLDALLGSEGNVIRLTNQQQQSGNPDGQRLTQLAQYFAQPGPTKAGARRLLRFLQSRVVQPAQWVPLIHTGDHGPRVVTARNDANTLLNGRLLMLQAARHGRLVIRWYADHTLVSHRTQRNAQDAPVTGRLRDLARRLPSRGLDRLSAVTLFYDGALFVLLEGQNAAAGLCCNNTVIARGLVLHEDEPPPNVVSGVWNLRYIPLALLVQPDGFPADMQLLPGDSELARSTAGLIPIRPVNSKTIRVTLPQAVDLGNARGPVTFVLLRRRNIPAVPAYAVTGRPNLG
ncbi:hypothetical protein PLESTM_000932100 [Pleodorina starrii]|nr:hypothetical protein PLESTM_000932100 [Pleodorina starrii]